MKQEKLVCGNCGSSNPEDLGWGDIWKIAQSAYEEGYKQALVDLGVETSYEEDTNVLIGYLSKAWGEVGYHTCEIGHPIYRNKLYDSLTYKSLKADIEKTAKFFAWGHIFIRVVHLS